MITPSVVEQVKHLLSDGSLSQRKIAKMTGVSRGTIGAIASGKRRDIRPPRKPWYEEPDEPLGPPRRCSGCGAIVQPPCRACRLRELLAAGRVKHKPDRADYVLGLELSDDHQARYKQVRARRIEEERLREECDPVSTRGSDSWNR